jgi:hypothetical protein
MNQRAPRMTLPTLTDPCCVITFSLLTYAYRWDDQFEVVAQHDGTEGVIDHCTAWMRPRNRRDITQPGIYLEIFEDHGRSPRFVQS